MHVILTHEQADFDAVASLLGAHLLYPGSIPVIPHKLNRNVRAFINLYATELPFKTMDEIGAGGIARITLVDSQSLMTIKGLSKSTLVHVIDHHEKKPKIPGTWVQEFHKLGANTTYLVEKLEAKSTPISEISATLLLLGIFEDTGSFSYKSTTPDDFLMAGSLLNHGANIQAVDEYLNPPLTGEQQRVFQALLDQANNYSIHGQRIIIAKTNIEKMNDEISSIAHKMRDYLDPDGLFLIFRSSEGIRLIARSTSDRINVASALSPFGGGGHERAAAGLINVKNLEHEPSLDEIEKELLAILDTSISVQTPVHLLMSPNPKMISPSTTAKEAQKMMLRYGYEGFPVIDRGKVMGLLTRKAVDRAINHNLDLPAKSLMEMGAFAVYESDDVTQLQAVMSESGWGQVPVLESITGKVKGIATRTDLLKYLSKRSLSLPEKTFAAEIKKRLNPSQLAILNIIAQLATDLNTPAYIVGGFVRDFLLLRKTNDFDIVIEGDAIPFCKELADRYGGLVTSHSRFGTAKWNLNKTTHLPFEMNRVDCSPSDADLPGTIDFISARTEYYTHPTALPSVERGNIKLDLQRRDFSINSMAFRLDGDHFGELIDFFNGLDDLHKKEIRTLHPLSFIDDPTRIIRAVRFATRFTFSIQSRTAELMGEAKDHLRSVSGTRIKHEFDQVFEEADPGAILDSLASRGILEPIHPDLAWNERIAQVLSTLPGQVVAPFWRLPDRIGSMSPRVYSSYLAWLGCLPLEKAMKLLNRFHLPAVMINSLTAISKIDPDLHRLSALPPSGIAKRLDFLHPLALYTLFLKSTALPEQELILRYAREWSSLKTFLDGNNLKQMGVKAGPEIKRVLEKIRYLKIDGQLQTEKDEKDYVKSLLASLKG